MQQPRVCKQTQHVYLKILNVVGQHCTSVIARGSTDEKLQLQSSNNTLLFVLFELASISHYPHETNHLFWKISNIISWVIQQLQRGAPQNGKRFLRTPDENVPSAGADWEVRRLFLKKPTNKRGIRESDLKKYIYIAVCWMRDTAGFSWKRSGNTGSGPPFQSLSPRSWFLLRRKHLPTRSWLVCFHMMTFSWQKGVGKDTSCESYVTKSAAPKLMKKSLLEGSI